jgi:hypothetical protein
MAMNVLRCQPQLERFFPGTARAGERENGNGPG